MQFSTPCQVERPLGMKAFRILIVDDEPLARERLRDLLRSEPSAELIGECTNGPDAIAAIRRDRPDVVFLDVQMPGCDGIQVVHDLPAEHRPAIVFVTAHDRFAIEAFGVHATDYLLKPFDRDRLVLALQRATADLGTRHTVNLGARLGTVLAHAASAPRQPARLAFRSDGRYVFLDAGEIRWAEADGNYVRLHVVNRSPLMLHDTLSTIEERLGPAEFTRINRSAVVRRDQVKEIQFTAHGDYIVVLRDGTTLPLSRSQRSRLDAFGADGA